MSTTPPHTPLRSFQSLPPSSSSHSLSSPNLLTPASSIPHTSPIVFTPTARSSSPRRPRTPPLDFFTRPTKSTMMPDSGTAVSLTSTGGSALSDSSEVLPRPSPSGSVVDPAIKGVPQGWDEDPSIQVKVIPTILDAAPSTLKVVPDPRSRSASRPGLRTPSADQYHTRLNSFRGETRSKLSTWRDKAFPELAEGRRRREAAFGPPGGSPAKGQTAGEGRRESGWPEARPGLLSRPSVPRPSHEYARTAALTSTSASAVPARLGISVSVPSQPGPSTLASTLVSDEDFNDLFTPSSTSKLTFPLSPTFSTVDHSRPPISHRSASTPLSGLPRASKEDARSMTSTQSSTSTRNRERVMGRSDPLSPTRPTLTTNASRLFAAPDVHDVLPFASSRLGSAWDLPRHAGEGQVGKNVSPVKSSVRAMAGKGRRTSMSLESRSEEGLPMSAGGKFGSASTSSGLIVPRSEEEEVVTVEGWKDRPRPASGTGQKRVWVGADGQEVPSVYRVGWEKEVMDVEARLHESMYDLAGERHSFISVKEGKAPKTVLDIGTGLGLWPVSQALLWRGTQFVGLDIVPCQMDLGALVKAEKIARSSSAGMPPEEGLWEGVEKRITWDRANFLTTLPYDTGAFDMVHLRFLSLGLPESAWPQLLDEALRVLSPGGHLEIVDMSITLPSSAPASLQRSFASMLLAEMINPDPSLPVQFALPMLDGLKSGMGRPVFDAMGDGVCQEAVWVWVSSALEYKGTAAAAVGSGTGVAGRDRGMVSRIKGALTGWESGRWGWEGDAGATLLGGDVSVDNERQGDEGPKVWAWVGRKRGTLSEVTSGQKRNGGHLACT